MGGACGKIQLVHETNQDPAPVYGGLDSLQILRRTYFAKYLDRGSISGGGVHFLRGRWPAGDRVQRDSSEQRQLGISLSQYDVAHLISFRSRLEPEHYFLFFIIFYYFIVILLEYNDTLIAKLM